MWNLNIKMGKSSATPVEVLIFGRNGRWGEGWDQAHMLPLPGTVTKAPLKRPGTPETQFESRF